MTWRCFHCNNVFKDKAEAERHFGKLEGVGPVCKTDVRITKDPTRYSVYTVRYSDGSLRHYGSLETVVNAIRDHYTK